MTTDIKELDALAQAISDAETREGRDITEDETLVIARSLSAVWTPKFLISVSMEPFLDDIAIARAAYAAGRAPLVERIAELEAEVAQKSKWVDAIRDGSALMNHAQKLTLRVAELEAVLADVRDDMILRGNNGLVPMSRSTWDGVLATLKGGDV